MENKNLSEEFDDDIPVGRVLSRREVIALLGGTGAASFMMLAGCGGGGTTATISTPTPTPTPTPSGSTSPTPTPSASASPTPTPSASASPTPTPTPTPTAAPTPTPTPTPTPSPSPTTIAGCVASPVETIGPYFVEEKLNRSDIRSDPTTGTVLSGIPLSLTLYVANASGACGAISGATVDIWHCNASGVYSDEAANNTSGQKFLRGYQTTDSSGRVQFTTIYPGWYSGRTVHIHVRVRFTANGKSYDFISQLFFNDSLTDTVLAQSPYSSRGTRDTRNSNDNIYSSQMQMTLTGSTSGYSTTFVIGIA